MLLSIVYVILAILGIGFLIFIHELGHYYMARKVGITVEVFAIGFGKSIYEWEHKGVKWKLGWLPFGGYVKMAGTERKGNLEPHQIPDGFFSKSPWARIKVAGMGPLVNIIFAFLAFTLLWMTGGREKPFAEFTQFVGWVDSDSSLYSEGLRPGDRILQINGHSYKGFNDLIYSTALVQENPRFKGLEIDYFKGEKEPFNIALREGENLKGMEKVSLAVQSFRPANFLISAYVKDTSPMAKSGIQPHERIIWADGELIFSQQQLVQILNDSKVLLTVKRDDHTFLTRIPRMKISDLQLEPAEVGELDDWKFEAGLSPRIEELHFIPYNVSAQGVVENNFSYIDAQSQVQKTFDQPVRSSIEIPLQRGDQIIAVEGTPVNSSYELLRELQTKQVQIVVEKMRDLKPYPWKEADAHFVSSFDITNLKKIIDSPATNPVTEAGSLRLLKPVIPVSMNDFPLPEDEKQKREEKLYEERKKLGEISDPQKREAAIKDFEESQKRVMLGVQLQDHSVSYNPNPIVLFGDVFQSTWRTLVALVTGYLSPKHIAGPVGIINIIQHSWASGVKEALYWLAMISLNLGMINLLPIPVLDGGHICFSVVEGITKKPIKAKTMERLIIPFVILLIGFFVYLTYHDIMRLFSRFF